VEKENDKSYNQIAKSTGIFGGSQLLIILIGIVRTKILAVLLGTAGIGLVGLYQSVIDFFKTFAGMGFNFSLVREVSKATESGDNQKIIDTISVSKRLLWYTGLLGMFLLIVFCVPASKIFFGDSSKSLHLCLLSFAVLTGILSTGQVAYLQGTRQILKMAKATLYGATAGLIISVTLYYIFGIDGIVPALICASVINLFFSWFFAHKQLISNVKIGFRETMVKGMDMIKLGFFTMLTGIVSTLAMLMLKSFILKVDSLETLGLYQAVWSVSFTYIGALLASMGADYYPKLCGLTEDNNSMVKFANQQTRFVILISSPVLIIALLMSVPILSILYSDKFIGAGNLMYFQIFGLFLKVIIWPAGFVLLAKGKGLKFFLVDFIWFILYYSLTCFGWRTFGVESAGIAFVISYLIYLPLVYYMVKPLCELKYEKVNVLYFIVFLLLMSAALVVSLFFDGWTLAVIGIIISILALIIAIHGLNKIIPAANWMNYIKRVINK
jgi:PST family polysaccharide transporter